MWWPVVMLLLIHYSALGVVGVVACGYFITHLLLTFLNSECGSL